MAGEQLLNGKDYLLEIDITTPITAEKGLDYHPIVCEVVSTFRVTTDELSISNSCVGRWKARIPNRSTFSFNGEWQAINPATGEPDAHNMNVIAYLATTRRMFWARRKLKEGALGAEVYREGVVWINNYEDTASVEEPFTFLAEFVGTGEPQIDGGYDMLGILADSSGTPIVNNGSFIGVKAGDGAGGAEPEVFTTGLIIGADNAMGLENLVLTQDERTRGYDLRTIAGPSDTIAEQSALWNSIANKNIYDYVIVNIGMNDLDNPTMMTDYQAFISRIKASGKVGLQVIVTALTPARQWFLDQNKPERQVVWGSFNNAVTNGTIIGASGKASSYVSVLSDGNSNLQDIYDAGNHVLLTDSGKRKMAESWRNEIIRLKIVK